MQIFIKTATGGTITIDVESWGTVEACKRYIGDFYKFVWNALDLYHEGQLLKDDDILEDVGIRKESTLILHVREYVNPLLKLAALTFCTLPSDLQDVLVNLLNSDAFSIPDLWNGRMSLEEKVARLNTIPNDELMARALARAATIMEETLESQARARSSMLPAPLPARSERPVQSVDQNLASLMGTSVFFRFSLNRDSAEPRFVPNASIRSAASSSSSSSHSTTSSSSEELPYYGMCGKNL